MKQNTRNKLLLTTVLLMSASAGAVNGATPGSGPDLFSPPTAGARSRLAEMPGTAEFTRRVTDSLSSKTGGLSSPLKRRMVAAGLKKALTVYRAQKDEIESTLAERAQARNFEARLDAARSESAETVRMLETARLESREVVRTLTEQNRTIESRCSELNSQLQSKRAELESANAEKLRIQSEYASASEAERAELEAQREQNSKLTAELTQVVEFTEAQLVESTQEFEERNKKLLQYKAKCAQLELDLSFERTKNESLHRQLRDAGFIGGASTSSTASVGGSGTVQPTPPSFSFDPTGSAAPVPPTAGSTGTHGDAGGVPPSDEGDGSDEEVPDADLGGKK